MNIPPEVFVWVGGLLVVALCGLISVVLHLLISIYRNTSEMKQDQAVMKEQIKVLQQERSRIRPVFSEEK